MTIDTEECQTVNTQKDDNYHKISHTMPMPRTNITASWLLVSFFCIMIWCVLCGTHSKAVLNESIVGEVLERWQPVCMRNSGSVLCSLYGTVRRAALV